MRGEEAMAIAALAEGLTIFREIGTLDQPARVRDALAMLDAGSFAAGHAYNH
jgi:hypothetical protein